MKKKFFASFSITGLVYLVVVAFFFLPSIKVNVLNNFELSFQCFFFAFEKTISPVCICFRKVLPEIPFQLEHNDMIFSYEDGVGKLLIFLHKRR